MGVPSNKYSKDLIMGVVQGMDKPLVRQALALQEYSSDSKFRALFWCDKVRHRTDSEGKEVVIGMCKTANAVDMHAAKRHSKIRMMIDGEEYTVFNDSGLHTLAMADVNEVLTKYKYSNYIKVDGYVISAYYDKTDKIEVSGYNVTTSKSLFGFVEVQTNVPAGVSLESTIWLIRSGGQAAKGDTIKLTVRATNSEGQRTVSTVQFVCDGVVGDLFTWRLLTSQSQQPSTGIAYTVMLTPVQENYIRQTILQSSAKAWSATNEHSGLVDGVHGKVGESVDIDEVLASMLPQGHYYGIDDERGNRVILLVDSNSEPYGWCSSTYNPPTPPTPQTNPLSALTVDIEALYMIGRDGTSVSLSNMVVKITNGGEDDFSVDVTVQMIDAQSAIMVGSKSDELYAGALTELTVLDIEKDEAISYSSATGTPTARVTIETIVDNITYNRQWEIELQQ